MGEALRFFYRLAEGNFKELKICYLEWSGRIKTCVA